jgi:hypothetical protein
LLLKLVKYLDFSTQLAILSGSTGQLSRFLSLAAQHVYLR